MTKSRIYLLSFVAAAVLAAAAAYFYLNARPSVPAGQSTGQPGWPAPADSQAASAPAGPHERAPAYPIEAVAASAAASAPAPLDEAGVEAALIKLLGRDVVLSLVLTDDFARRLVATVDNLGRAAAPSKLWPVKPAGGQFTTSGPEGATVIDRDNAKRYEPYVRLLENADLGRVVSLYVSMYPLLQRAYEDLGYPRRHFNDRLVEVIDTLLATPDIAKPLAVYFPRIDASVQPSRPWVLYEFSDEALRTLPAGQKLMLRMGADNQRRVKAFLSALRQKLASTSPPAVTRHRR